MEIRIDHPEFHASVADVRRAGALLAEAQARARGQVGVLLDGGWSGAAATSFGEAWDDWVRAAAVVRSDLGAIADLLARVHAAQIEVDDLVYADLGRLSERLS